MSSGTHYSNVFNRDMMLNRAEQIATDIEETYPDAKICLVYTGFSGISHATYLAQALEKAPLQIYVRKDGEVSHGDPIEISSSAVLDYPPSQYSEQNPTGLLLVFVDDFVSTGDTLRRCAERLCLETGRYMLPCVVAVFQNFDSNHSADIPYLERTPKTLKEMMTVALREDGSVHI